MVSAIELCISAIEDPQRLECMEKVLSLLKEEVEKEQSLLNSNHDKVVKVCCTECGS